MREIKFRGRNYDGVWMYGYLMPTPKPQIHPNNQYCISVCSQALTSVDKALYEVETDTIGQFTGLHDKNGKEIYEGDIIRGDCGNGEVRHLISFYDMIASFVAEMLPDNDINDYCALSQIWILKYNKEVLGNIHDNPELLNSKTE